MQVAGPSVDNFIVYDYKKIVTIDVIGGLLILDMLYCVTCLIVKVSQHTHRSITYAAICISEGSKRSFQKCSQKKTE